MSEDTLGYYILYRQHFGDGSSLEARVGPMAEDTARSRLKKLVESGDTYKSDFRLVHRHETLLDKHE